MNRELDDSQTVFIVDDDTAICAGLCDLFESVNLKARHFSSAEDFLERWDPTLSGCLVLDVRLPGMNGMEMHAKLVDSGIPLPVVIMTGHGDMPMVRKALKAGAIEFLIKPFQDQELLGSGCAGAGKRRSAGHHQFQLSPELLFPGPPGGAGPRH
jgi:FixJ family two-component response regulator